MSDIEILRAEFRTVVREVKAICETPTGEWRNLTDEESAKATALMDKGRDLKDRITLAENQAKAEQGGAGFRDELQKLGDSIARPSAMKSAIHPRVKAAGGSDWGEKVIRAVSGPEGFKGLLSGGAVPLTIPLESEPVRIGVPALVLRQLIPTVTGPSRFSYMRQTVRTNNAAVVARGALKPTSIFTMTRVDDRTRTIAHLSEPVARQDLRDAPMLQRFLDMEMRLGVEMALEQQIINGSGSGENMTGIANVSGSQAQAWDTDILTTMRKAKTKLETLSFSDGAAYVIHPNDWETIELLADNEAQYYLGGPVQTVDVNARRLWGMPVVSTTAQSVGVAHLANFKLATELQIAEDMRFDWSENIYDPDAISEGVGASDFQRNMIRFRAEMDAGLKIYQPSAIVEIDLTA
ncbi:phage major capsid protein [Streptomyces sp. H27-H1]|uniref:phage major capsid protein n=1 Tax=Streptomyces sp. H27-H1 TaxID=2996461 RepID=UPI00226FA7A6|nr:phage major capsid protein [Streptomyces sp. H27-H1]MCY0931178.1 phage major capsid protein [Streptomyces sp. H27-H1]